MNRPRRMLVVATVAALTLPDLRAQPQTPSLQLIRPADLEWTENPAVPSGGGMSVVLGRPREQGRYVMRLAFPAGHKVMPHTHPEDRIYTVISGTWYVGQGDRFDPARLQALPAGSICVIPGGIQHYQWVPSGQVTLQVDAVGPTATDYVVPAHDPRRK